MWELIKIAFIPTAASLSTAVETKTSCHLTSCLSWLMCRLIVSVHDKKDHSKLWSGKAVQISDFKAADQPGPECCQWDWASFNVFNWDIGCRRWLHRSLSPRFSGVVCLTLYIVRYRSTGRPCQMDHWMKDYLCVPMGRVLAAVLFKNA